MLDTIKEKTVLRLQKEFLDVNIFGYKNVYFKEDEKGKVIKNSNIVFIAQGSPRQEYFIEELIKVHPGLYMRLGISFDVYFVLKKCVPKNFIDSHVKRLYKLLKKLICINCQLAYRKCIFLLYKVCDIMKIYNYKGSKQ